MALQNLHLKYSASVVNEAKRTVSSTVYATVISQQGRSVRIKLRGAEAIAQNLGTGSLEEGESIVLLIAPDGGLFTRGRNTLSY